WKRRMGLVRARYIGLAKVAGQILLTAMAFNLRRLAALTA
ncbi:MAG: transposase, partial [Phenylobacterium sp.]|nr:transposase [Phenylobacterium sp.]